MIYAGRRGRPSHPSVLVLRARDSLHTLANNCCIAHRLYEPICAHPPAPAPGHAASITSPTMIAGKFAAPPSASAFCEGSRAFRRRHRHRVAPLYGADPDRRRRFERAKKEPAICQKRLSCTAAAFARHPIVHVVHNVGRLFCSRAYSHRGRRVSIPSGGEPGAAPLSSSQH